MKDTPKGTGFVIAADDGGLYEISHDDLIRAAKKVSPEDPGYRILQDAANAGLDHATLVNQGKVADRHAVFVCKTFSQCSHSKNLFVNVRGNETPNDD